MVVNRLIPFIRPWFSGMISSTRSFFGKALNLAACQVCHLAKKKATRGWSALQNGYRGWISNNKGWKRTQQLMARESNQEIFEVFELTSSWDFCWQTHGGRGSRLVVWMQGSTFRNSLESWVFEKWPEVEVLNHVQCDAKNMSLGFFLTTTATTTAATTRLLLLLFLVLLLLLMIGYTITHHARSWW